ncbi:phosphoenolpyruvate carboxylase [Gammaproteobacteria bacterium]|nr:phosphoenolpyruvate carboxylase [Gammaproteobacteria bacterium]
MTSKEGLGLPAKIPSNRDYENLVDLNYQLYNGLFLTLPLDEIEQTGMLLPLLEARAQKGLSQGDEPAQILEDFFTTHRTHLDEQGRIHFLFRVIKYVERQVVLVDALEDAAYPHVHKTETKNVLRQLTERVKADGLQEQFDKVLENFGSKVILTAHPTQFYPGQVLAIITDLAAAIRQQDIATSRDLLQQLGNTPFFNSEKPTPYDEATNLSWYLANIFYDAIGGIMDSFDTQLADRVDSPNQLLSVGFWPGGDRDGNPFVNFGVTLKVADKLRSLIMSCYHSDVRELKRRLSFKGVYKQLDELERKLLKEITKPCKTDLTLAGMIETIGQIEQTVKESYQGLYVELLESFKHKVSAFGFHFANLDIRQDSRVIHRSFDTARSLYPEYFPADFDSLDDASQIAAMLALRTPEQLLEFNEQLVPDALELDTLESLRAIATIQQRNGETGCHRYIISNCRGAIDIARVKALSHLVGWKAAQHTVDIAPLFETIDDLARAGASMTNLYSFADYRAHLARRSDRQTVMLGFSDGTKDGGYLMANWAIYRAKEDLTAVSRAAGVEVAFFDGRGGPPARGGGSTYEFYAALGKNIESNQIQLTVQGQTVSSYYGNSEAATHNLRQLLAAGLENNLYDRPERELNEGQRSLIQELAGISYERYKAFKAHPLFIPYLEEMSTLKYYGRTNIGSRPTKRGGSEGLKFEDLRAIPFVGAWAQLKQNVPGYYGLGTALQSLENAGRLDECKALYQSSKFFKALVDNSMQSMSKSNFELTAYMGKHPRFGKFWQQVHAEFELSVEMALKISNQSILLEDNPTSRLSIALRQKLVLPLLVIQQYALTRAQQLEGVLAEDNREESAEAALYALYEKMVMRSLFGNVNASRNSA